MSGPWLSGAGQGLRGRYGSGDLGRVCPVGFGFGDAAEGDFEAEGSELAGGGRSGGGCQAGDRSSPGRGPDIACRGWIAACGRPSAGCYRWRRTLWRCRACGPAAGAGRLRGSGSGRPRRRSRRDGAQVPVALLGRGAPLAFAGLVVLRGAGRPRRPGARRCGTWSCPRRFRPRRPGRRGAASRAATRPAGAVLRTGPAAARSPATGPRCRRPAGRCAPAPWPAGRRAHR